MGIFVIRLHKKLHKSIAIMLSLLLEDFPDQMIPSINPPRCSIRGLGVWVSLMRGF